MEKTDFNTLVKMQGLPVSPMGRAQKRNRRPLHANLRYFLKAGNIGMALKKLGGSIEDIKHPGFINLMVDPRVTTLNSRSMLDLKTSN